jgi:hypothetical protein
MGNVAKETLKKPKHYIVNLDEFVKMYGEFKGDPTAFMDKHTINTIKFADPYDTLNDCLIETNKKIPDIFCNVNGRISTILNRPWD